MEGGVLLFLLLSICVPKNVYAQMTDAPALPTPTSQKPIRQMDSPFGNSIWENTMQPSAQPTLHPSPLPELSATPEQPSESNVSIRGVLLERGTKVPLENVNVFILPHRLKATTDNKGRFHIQGVPSGSFQWVVNASGYEKLELSDTASEKESTREKRLYLEKKNYNIYETTVYGKAQKRDDSVKSLTAAQFATLPGSNGDPVKAVQNLPGVNRASPFSAQVIIQGSAPKDTRYQIESHEVPLIFHFGGLSSIMLPESIERVDYLSAGYGSDNGRAMGGIVGVWARKPKTDRYHGFGFVDIFNAGGAIEGPVGDESKKGSFLIGVRKSYIGEVLKQIAKDNEDFNLTAAPSFSDLTAVYDVELSPRDHFRWVTIGSLDTFEFVLKEPVDTDPELRGNFYQKTTFFRLIPQWTHQHGETLTSRWSLGLGRDWIRSDIGENYFYLKTWAVTARGEVEKRFSNSWTSFWGMDHRLAQADVALKIPLFFSQGGVENPLSSGEPVLTDLRVNSNQLGFYWRNNLVLGSRWTLSPSVRTDYFSTTRETLPAPRMAVRYQVDDSFFLRTAGGLYYQPPQEAETADRVGNPDLKAPRAWHAMVGAEKDFRGGEANGFSLSGGPFYRYFDRLVITSSNLITRNGGLVPEFYNNSGNGRAYGAESILRYNFNSFTGWLSYTISRSTRWLPNRPEYVSSFDQTHNLNLIGSVDLPRNWRISSRLRYVTGNPTTPVVGGVFDANNDVYLPLRGPYFSERLSPFAQLDLRIDKRWIYNRFILTAYLDIQNITNRKNSESVQYSYDYRSKASVTGLPILPTLGIKGEF